MNPERTWWKEAVVYQIYPQSFDDSDGDGVGDIPGIIDRLDYLADLGVDVVWLNPVYESPHHDDGYDVRDYRTVRDEYGDIADWERLLDGLHDRGMRLVMDFVPNHTSDEHPWFRASRTDPDGEYGDHYIWRPGDPATDATDTPGPADRTPPNDWQSYFGGPAWTWDDTRGAYYLHLFDEHQPDLDWTNPDVREGIYDRMNWWLEKGIDGFRLDVVNLISKPEGLPDGDPDGDVTGLSQCAEGPRLDEYLAEMREATFGRYDAVAIGETPDITLEEARHHTGPDGPLDMVFHFEHMGLDSDDEDGWWSVREWDLTELKRVVDRWQTGLGDGWHGVYLGNHDQPRIVSRFGDDGRYRRESATMLATLLLTLRGTPFIHQGDELGMTNYPFEAREELADAGTLGRIDEAVAAGRIDGFEDAREIIRYRTRDNARTPMQWDATEHAGFTTGEPWLPVNPDHETVNAERERGDPDSVLAYYRRLVALRGETPALVSGEYEPVLPDHESVFAYRRTLDGDRLLVLLNFDDGETTVDLSLDGGTRLFGNYGAPADRTVLRPYEARLYRLQE